MNYEINQCPGWSTPKRPIVYYLCDLKKYLRNKDGRDDDDDDGGDGD